MSRGQVSRRSWEGNSQGHPPCVRSGEERASLPCLLSSDASGYLASLLQHVSVTINGALRGLLRSLCRAEEQPFVPCWYLGVLPTVW